MTSNSACAPLVRHAVLLRLDNSHAVVVVFSREYKRHRKLTAWLSSGRRLEVITRIRQ